VGWYPPVVGLGDQRVACRAAVGGDGAAVGQQFAGVLEDDDAVAEQAPALLRETCDDPGGLAVDGFGRGAYGLVLAHRVLRMKGGVSWFT